LLAGARLDDKAFAEKRGPDPATLCTSGCGGLELPGIDDIELPARATSGSR
jgi:hypothetical protein